MSTNPSYNMAKQSRKQDQYDYVLHNKISYKDDQDAIKIDFNPSYGRAQGCNACDVIELEYDATIKSNSSYSSTSKESINMFEDEDQDGCVETNSQSMQTAGYRKIIGLPLKKRSHSMIMTLIILAMLKLIVNLHMI